MNLYFENPEKIELNLKNPIFVIYLNIEGLSRQSAQELIEKTRRHLDIYNNITMWFIASNVTKIECVYDGFSKNRDSELSNLIEEINARIDITVDSYPVKSISKSLWSQLEGCDVNYFSLNPEIEEKYQFQFEYICSVNNDVITFKDGIFG